jgi:XRE family transcriptional regulator, aerobic/anaerobic benzoate catabolism transcriptional regulator
LLGVETESLLVGIGRRVRARRQSLGWTLKGLAQRSGLSPRFVSQLEAGDGNIAIGRLDAVATALQLPLTALLEDRDGSRRQMDNLLRGRSVHEVATAIAAVSKALGVGAFPVIALLGMRGAGKSTVGPRLAERLGARFVELDAQVESAAGLRVAEIFALHGEAFYRRLEFRCLHTLLAGDAITVVATSGGIVTDESAWRVLLDECVTLWLEASPEEHMQRVVAQGDRRPMASSAEPMAELRTILASRTPRYRSATVRVSTSGVDVERVVDVAEAEVRRELSRPRRGARPG